MKASTLRIIDGRLLASGAHFFDDLWENPHGPYRVGERIWTEPHAFAHLTSFGPRSHAIVRLRHHEKDEPHDEYEVIAGDLPIAVNIPAGVFHEFEILADGTCWVCAHQADINEDSDG